MLNNFLSLSKIWLEENNESAEVEAEIFRHLDSVKGTGQ